VSRAISDYVFNPMSSFLGPDQRFVTQGRRATLNGVAVASVVEHLLDVVEQLGGREVMNIHLQSEAFSTGSFTVCRLFSKQWKAEHWNAMIESFVLPVTTAMSNKQSRLSMTKDVVLW